MIAFRHLEAIAAPLPLPNIDTDKILAARFLKTISREGLGEALFDTLRRQPDGQLRPDFVLNRAPWHEAQIIVALDNFGCGSSREHAPWALLDFGIRCIIAPSFADIFYNNCFKNGILPVRLPGGVDRLLALASDPATARMAIDLPTQVVTTADGGVFAFNVDPQRKQDLLDGTDEIARTLGLADDIAAFEASRAAGLRVPVIPNRF